MVSQSCDAKQVAYGILTRHSRGATGTRVDVGPSNLQNVRSRVIRPTLLHLSAV
jgi:hypothetical protein